MLKQLSFDEDEVVDFGDLVETANQQWRAGAEERARVLRLSLSAIDERMTKLTDAFLDGHVDADTFQKRKAALLKDHCEVSERLNSMAKEAAIPETILKFFELAKTPYLGYETANRSEQRDIVSTAMSNLVVHRKNLEVTLKFPYREVLKWRETESCGQHRSKFRTSLTKLLDILLGTA